MNALLILAVAGISLGAPQEIVLPSFPLPVSRGSYGPSHRNGRVNPGFQGTVDNLNFNNGPSRSAEPITEAPQFTITTSTRSPKLLQRLKDAAEQKTLISKQISQQELPFDEELFEFDLPCGSGKIKDGLGKCVSPDISREIYIFSPPEELFEKSAQPIKVPKPKISYNVIFVKAPNKAQYHEPVIVPPPQQKTLVYVLNEGSKDAPPRKIYQTPTAPPVKPEVFYVNYDDKINHDIIGNVDLKTALKIGREEEGKLIGEEDVRTLKRPSQLRHLSNKVPEKPERLTSSRGRQLLQTTPETILASSSKPRVLRRRNYSRYTGGSSNLVTAQNLDNMKLPFSDIKKSSTVQQQSSSSSQSYVRASAPINRSVGHDFLLTDQILPPQF